MVINLVIKRAPRFVLFRSRFSFAVEFLKKHILAAQRIYGTDVEALPRWIVRIADHHFETKQNTDQLFNTLAEHSRTHSATWDALKHIFLNWPAERGATPPSLIYWVGEVAFGNLSRPRPNLTRIARDLALASAMRALLARTSQESQPGRPVMTPRRGPDRTNKLKARHPQLSLKLSMGCVEGASVCDAAAVAWNQLHAEGLVDGQIVGYDVVVGAYKSHLGEPLRYWPDLHGWTNKKIGHGGPYIPTRNFM